MSTADTESVDNLVLGRNNPNSIPENLQFILLYYCSHHTQTEHHTA